MALVVSLTVMRTIVPTKELVEVVSLVVFVRKRGGASLRDNVDEHDDEGLVCFGYEGCRGSECADDDDAEHHG